MKYKNKNTGEIIDLNDYAEFKEPIDGFKNSVKQVIKEKTLEWGECSETSMTWEEAKKWCEERGGRLPTRIELLQVYEDGVEGFKMIDNEDSLFWSSTEYDNSTASAWYVYLYNGYTYTSSKVYSYYVRCVRP